VVGSTWNSLEVAKLAVALLTPVLLLGLGVVITRAARRVEHAQWANRKLIERRLELYDEMAPLLNDLYCFVGLVGDFRRIEPPRAIELKRRLDKLFHVNKFLFSDAFARRWEALMDLCFETYTGYGNDARIRVDAESQEAEMGSSDWRAEWRVLFSPRGEHTQRGRIKYAIAELMETFADEIGVREKEKPVRPAGRARRTSFRAR
jgi:hypothetical protein